ncbi:hypothetical protein ACFYV7_02030 [Nocardia suismassiliense]|uniref:Uncharacterized protein n=1 Tax=Nocardia suismassiliense TaxID=2077092 RepID=A0ABW6QK17_9NOCA
MTQATATTLAAFVAATASLVALAVAMIRDRRTELRASRREGLRPHVDELATATWECVAVAVVIAAKANSDQKVTEWITRGRSASESLKRLRLPIRYTVPGLEGPIRTLSLIPDWAAHVRKDAARSTELSARATDLRKAIDACIIRVTIAGLPPRKRDVRRALKASAAALAVFGDGR